MKKLLLAFIIFFPVSVFAGTYDNMAKELMKKIPAKDKTKPIAVMPFSADEQFASDARVAEDELTKALINAGAQVSERSQIDKLLQEQALKQAGVLTDESAGEVGQGLGAKYVVLGTVTKLDKYGEAGNLGIKISVKLVTSSNYKTLAVASGEAAAGDASSKYKRKAPRKAAEYPQFLEAFGGATLFKYKADYEDLGEDKDDMNIGWSAGARIIKENTGFFTTGWEFLFSSQSFDDDTINQKYKIYQISWIPTLRIPLWSYIPVLPDYTSLSLAYAIGLGVNNVTYLKGAELEKTNSYGFGFCSSVILGFRLGLGESVSVFADLRYTPTKVNRFYLRSQDVAGEDLSVKDALNGPAVYFGLSLTP